MNAFASQPPIIPNIPGILGFDHVGVAVADLNEGITFYQNILVRSYFIKKLTLRKGA